MKKLEKKIFATAFSIIALNYIIVANAHDITNVTMDPEGINAGFLGYAQFSCFDDGNGLPDSLIIAIKDLSPPQQDLLVSAQIIGKSNAANTTDPISGDSENSPEIRVHEGSGPYLVLVNKSGPGPREFSLTYHCETIDNRHTGTNPPKVIQFQ
ncbi:hypothetical protein ABF87_09005 [Nitrosomonas sp. JL21]|uniref:hypothetical protein n=1 Tax=Nitrosomonas sp. JL21 TaxID=153949 RepID=UPI001367F7C4|nr:hypothetical protein [Nitrosomonas sp. JL21]MXS78092.1 hypothetical protein [Nitrosomonas sp. JL21]